MSYSDQAWTQTILPENSTIRQAIQILNENSLKIVLVVDPSGILIGTISDGDIRRGILKGLELTSSVQSIVHRDALVVPPELTQDAIVQLMSTNKIYQIPIVDENLRVVGLHIWDEISTPSTRPNIMVIMAGGKGTRLHPQTENCPKPLLPVSGKPILEHIIERAKIEGFYHFVIAIYHLGHMIEEYFGNGDRFGVKIEYLRESSPLGTAGALSLLDPIPDSSFVVTNGDVITDIRYGEILNFHQIHNAMATMAVRLQEWQNPFGVVKTHGIDIIDYEEKPVSRTHINAGVYVIEPSALKHLSRSATCDMPTLFEYLQKNRNRIIAYPIHEQWLDVGRPDDLSRANLEL
jgi:dTDP-glucose pyrophosphorylase